MNSLPPGWVEAPVGEIASSLIDGPFGSNLKSEHYQSSGVRVIRLQNIADGRFDDRDKAYISLHHFNKLNRHEARPGDVLVAALGEVLPRACLVPPDIDRAIVKADCFRLRPHEGISANYLAYILSAPQIRKRASTEIAGVGRPRLNLRKVSALVIPVPPSAEQERIVAAIEEQFSRIDAGVGALERVRRKLSRVRAAALQAAISGRLVAGGYDEPSLASDLPPTAVIHSCYPHRPPNWVTTTISAIAYVTSGATPLRSQKGYWANGSIPWITSTLVNNETITSAREYITPLALEKTGVKLMPAGTLLVAMYGEGRTRGHCSELLIEATTNQACAGIVLNESWAFVKPFLKLVLNASYEANRRLSAGGVQPNLSVGIIKRLPISLPPRNEQRRICEEVAAELSLIDQLDAALRRELTLANHLRASILGAAFSGRLVPHDPADEPASALLGRIAAERAASNGRTRTSKPRRSEEKVTL